MNKQFHVEHGYDTEAQAVAAVDGLKGVLLKGMGRRGYSDLTAPPLPFETSFAIAETQGPFRVLVAYIAPWIPNQWADKFVARVDTVAEAPCC